METSKDELIVEEIDKSEEVYSDNEILSAITYTDEPKGTIIWPDGRVTSSEVPQEELTTNEAKDEDLGDKPFNGFKYPSHALEEESKLIEKFEKEVPNGMVAVKLGPPAESESQYNHFSSKEEEKVDMINLDEIMLEFTKDYNLDSLKYPEIKKNMLRAFGTLKNIIADNNDEIEMTRDDWDRFHSNISKHVLSLKDKIAEIQKIINIKTSEMNALKSKLGNKHEDIRDIEDKLGPLDIEISNLKIREGNLSKELATMKAIKTQVFAKEKKYVRMYQHTQLMLGLAIMIKQHIQGKDDLLNDFCSNHDETTKEKIKGYIDAIVNDEWLNKPIVEEEFMNELADLTENSLDEQKEQAEYFKNLSIGTMYKVAEMFGWDIPIKPNDDSPEADNLVVSQISKKLMNVVNGTAPESDRFTKEDKNQLLDLIRFNDIFVGQGLEKMINSTSELAHDFKVNTLKFRYKQMSLLGKHLFSDIDIEESKRNRLISALILSLCKLDTLAIVFYLV